MKASDTQIGGGHYKDMPIEPAEFCQRNRIPWCEANAIKYLVRHRDKNGLEDLEKAKHYIDLAIEWEYTDGNSHASLAAERQPVLETHHDSGISQNDAEQRGSQVSGLSCSDCGSPLRSDFERLSLQCANCRSCAGSSEEGHRQPAEADAGCAATRGDV